MASFSTIERKDLRSDGKVKRKYELPEATPESFSLKVAGGFLLATTMLVVKSIFFGSDDAEAKSKDKAERPGEQEQAQAVVIDGSELENLQVIEHHGQSNSFDGDQVADGASPGGSSRFRGTSNPEEYGDPAATQVFAPQLSTNNVVQLPTSNYRGTGSNQAVVDIAGDTINTGRPSNGGGGSSGSQSPVSASDSANPTDSADPTDPADQPTDDQQNPPPRPLINRLPVVSGSVLLTDIFVNQSFALAMATLLEGAHDADGDTLTVQNLTVSSGDLSETPDGTWTFTPEAYDIGEVHFFYEISDGEGAIDQTALLEIMSLPGEEFFGTSGDDLIIGTAGPDLIEGYAGDDTIHGREDADLIMGGEGNDRILGGLGDDEIYGGAGNDIILAGAGDDIVYAGSGDDYVDGEAGDDLLYGEEGDDIVLGGLGDDDIYGGDGDDTLEGNEGNDVVIGGLGDDNIDGGDGDDALIGDDGADIILAGLGNDTAIGGKGDDDIRGDDGNDVLSGGAGNDSMRGDDGNDRLFGDAGDDTLMGNDGNDSVFGGDGNDDIDGGDGNDLLVGDAGQDILSGDDGDDTVFAGADSDTVDLGDGQDVAVAEFNDGNDSYDGGDGSDTFDASQLTEQVTIDLNQGFADSAQSGVDDLTNFENAVGGSGDDVIVANDSVNHLQGGAGHDLFVFLQGNKSGSGGHIRDSILDFEVGDKIDVSMMDGDDDEDGLQQLTFMYNQANFDGVGQVLYHYEEDGDRNTLTVLKFNFDDDDDDADEVDFEIEVIGRFEFSEDNLII